MILKYKSEQLRTGEDDILIHLWKYSEPGTVMEILWTWYCYGNTLNLVLLWKYSEPGTVMVINTNICIIASTDKQAMQTYFWFKD
jgi:hypothetical protein